MNSDLPSYPKPVTVEGQGISEEHQTLRGYPLQDCDPSHDVLVRGYHSAAES